MNINSGVASNKDDEKAVFDISQGSLFASFVFLKKILRINELKGHMIRV